MLFDNLMNKELQSFSRNIASQIFIGGTGLLFLYRADTKPGLVYYEFFGLYIVGLLLLTWSMYMALSNATILRNDYRDYLWRQSKKFDRIRLMKHSEKEDNKTSDILKTFKGLNFVDVIKFRFEGACILLMLFLFTIMYMLGIIAILFQQAKAFGF